MKKVFVLIALVLLCLGTSLVLAKGTGDCPKQTSCTCGQYVDANGDGICDNCSGCLPKGDDADGDGIPNGQDSDYVPPQDGSGK